MENKSEGFRRTDSDKASPLGPSSPYERDSQHPQGDAASSAADNDADRHTSSQHNLKKDADEAQSDGSLSFPKGK